MNKSHAIKLVIFEVLFFKLGLEPHILPSLHRLEQPSSDQLGFTKSIVYPTQRDSIPDIALGAHTDFGSITILFNRLDGLQVLGLDGKWMNIHPLPGHAIVNLGDAMVKLSSGILKSNIHRIVTIPGLKECVDRYSIVYFSRPENNVLMTSVIKSETNDQGESHILTAKEWIARRVKNYQTANYKDQSTYDSSRGTESDREAATEK